MPIPAMRYEWSPSTTGLATPSWEQFEQTVGGQPLAIAQHCNIKRGRPNEYSRFEAGTMTLRFHDLQRSLDPTWTGGHYGSNVAFDKRIRAVATWSGTDYTLFDGFIDSVIPQWSDPADCDVEIVAVDALGLLNLRRIAGTAYYDAVTADSPFAFYRLGEINDQRVRDEITGFYGSTLGALRGVPGALPAETDTATDFGTREGYAVLDSTAAFVGTGAFSLEAWLLPRSVDPSGIDLWYSQGDNISAAVVGAFLNADYTIQFAASDGVGLGSHVGVVNSSVPLNAYQWNHVVIVKTGADAASWKTYINGTDVTGTSTTGGNPNIPTFTIPPMVAGQQGAGGSGLVPRFDGAVDEVAMYPAALSAGQVAAHYAAAGNFRDNRLAGDRIADVLDAMGWPAGLRSIESGVFQVKPAPSPMWKQTALTYLEAVAASDGYPAHFYAARDGTLVFYDRSHAVPASSATFDDSHFHYELPLPPAMASTDYFNEVVADADGLPTQTASATLAADTPVRTMAIGGLVNQSAADVATIAADALARGNDPRAVRLRQMNLHPGADDSLYPMVLLFDLMGRLTVGRVTVPGGGSAAAFDVRIQHLEHDIDHAAGDMRTVLQLAPT